MDECNKSYRLPGLALDCETAILQLERDGQETPDTSDRVVVKATILLPAKPSGYLINEIGFGQRLTIADESLTCDWGKSNSTGASRYRIEFFAATTWREAFERADRWGTAEIEKLIMALRVRQQALVDAEGDPEF